MAFLSSKVYWETLWEFADLAELIMRAEVVGWWAAEGSLIPEEGFMMELRTGPWGVGKSA